MKKTIVLLFALCSLFTFPACDTGTGTSTNNEEETGNVDDGTFEGRYTGDELTITGYVEGAVLGDITIPSTIEGKTVVAIDSVAFYGCDGEDGTPDITSVVFPSSLRKIEGSAFADNGNLHTISLKDGLERLNYDAFRGAALTA
ncbi:leucine-rich repeat protein, partial [Oceanispirochaeta sp.]|uniref:leucine-rich repeat protein n=1 Tax=Oceanispirochaeta sp. TaxID=2035350 RepID=UPI0026161462